MESKMEMYPEAQMAPIEGDWMSWLLSAQGLMWLVILLIIVLCIYWFVIKKKAPEQYPESPVSSIASQ